MAYFDKYKKPDFLKRLYFSVVITIVLVQTIGAYFLGTGIDFAAFREATLLGHHPDVWLPAYAFWLFRPFMWLPFRLSLGVMVLISASLTAYAAHKVTGNSLPALLSMSSFLSVETGQINGFIAAGLALGILAAKRRNPHLLGVAIFLMCIKPQLGLVAAIWLIAYLRDWRALVIPACVLSLSLLTDGLWPLTLFQSPPSFLVKPIAHNISLWQSGGPAVLPLLALPFLISRHNPRHAVALSVTVSSLAMPFSNFYTLHLLFVTGTPGWLAPLTYLPVLPGWPAAWEMWRFQVLAIVPILSLVALAVPPEVGKQWLQRRFGKGQYVVR